MFMTEQIRKGCLYDFLHCSPLANSDILLKSRNGPKFPSTLADLSATVAQDLY